MFYVAALMAMQPESAVFLVTLLGLLVLGPAMLSPLAKIPEIRLAMWPVSGLKRMVLGVFTRPEVRAAPFLWRLPGLEARQLVRTLDLYSAVAFSTGGMAYRFLADAPEPAAFGVLSVLVVVSLSTLAQNLFTLDGAARLRWELSPRRGWVHLWRKGRWLLGVTVVLTGGLAPLAGLTGMLVSLAVGHHTSVLVAAESPAWRFSAGRFFPQGFLQLAAGAGCGMAVAQGNYWYLPGAAVLYGVSLMVYGWVMERIR